MHQFTVCFGWFVFNDGPIRFLRFAVFEQFVESCQCFGSTRKYDNSRRRAIESMHDTQKHFAGLLVFVFDVFLDDIAEWFVARFVALHDIADAFVDDDDVVVFVENLEVGFVGEDFQNLSDVVC